MATMHENLVQVVGCVDGIFCGEYVRKHIINNDEVEGGEKIELKVNCVNIWDIAEEFENGGFYILNVSKGMTVCKITFCVDDYQIGDATYSAFIHDSEDNLGYQADVNSLEYNICDRSISTILEGVDIEEIKGRIKRKEYIRHNNFTGNTVVSFSAYEFYNLEREGYIEVGRDECNILVVPVITDVLCKNCRNKVLPTDSTCWWCSISDPGK